MVGRQRFWYDTFSFRLAVMGISSCWYHVQGKGKERGGGVANTFSRHLIAIAGMSGDICENWKA